MKTIEIGVTTPEADRARALHLARQLDSGAALPEALPQLNFTSIKQLFSAITEKRLELIRHVADQAGLNTRQLAQALGRDYKNVYEDVRALCEFGLLEKDARGNLRAPYEQLVIRADLHPARVA
jgi:predicted transcriptional regulator